MQCPDCGGTEFAEAVDNNGKRHPGCAHCLAMTGQAPEPQSYLSTLSSPPRKTRGQ
jgi:hypothetical protein